VYLSAGPKIKNYMAEHTASTFSLIQCQSTMRNTISSSIVYWKDFHRPPANNISNIAFISGVACIKQHFVMTKFFNAQRSIVPTINLFTTANYSS